jgi:hypothetical protein
MITSTKTAFLSLIVTPHLLFGLASLALAGTQPFNHPGKS